MKAGRERLDISSLIRFLFFIFLHCRICYYSLLVLQPAIVPSILQGPTKWNFLCEPACTDFGLCVHACMRGGVFDFRVISVQEFLPINVSSITLFFY